MAEENKTREFILSENVTEINVGNLIKEIRDINAYDDKEEEDRAKYERKPINLVVNTFGGSAYDCLGLIAAILTSKTPVYTYCYGKAMSAGFFIFVAGHKRFAHSFSTLMYHTMRGWMGGDIQFLKENQEEWERVHKILEGIVLDKTNILKDKLDQVREHKSDWYISGEEAKKLGIVDEVL